MGNIFSTIITIVKTYLTFLFLSGIINIRLVKYEVVMSHIVIDETRCKACYLCINECPKKLIKKSDRVNKLGARIVECDDPEHVCLGCAMCATRCPDMAITEVYKG